MADLASAAAGGHVLMVSSLDPSCPAERVIDGDDCSFWISTGLYPQEILLGLGRPSPVSSVRLSSTKVRHVRVEGCGEGAPVHFQLLAESEFHDAEGGHMQVEELSCKLQARPMGFVRVLILSGWHAFCSVHSIQVRPGEAVRRGVGIGGSDPATSRHPCDEHELLGGSLTISHTASAQCNGETLGASLTLSRTEDASLNADVAATANTSLQASWMVQVQRDGLLLRFAAQKGLAADRDVALAAVRQNGDALQFASEELRADREVVLAAVRGRGNAVRWASGALRADREVALAAVCQCGTAIQSLAKELLADREVVLAALRQKGSVLRDLPLEFRSDPEFVQVACSSFYFTKGELHQLRQGESSDEEEPLDATD
mmetsp:Transcript_43184/g.119442  ORF Transcript_43184/g.119442 Transcript_43184/m.119442 type:complete len:374 (+) Transcript_43184:28-1149(+)